MLFINSLNPYTYACAWTVVHSTWQILLIAFFATLLQTLLHKKKASTRYNVLIASTFLIAITACITFIIKLNEVNNIQDATMLNQTNIGNEVGQFSADAVFVGRSTDDSFMQKTMAYVNKHILLIILIWVIGMVLALIRLIGNISYVLYVKNNFNFPVDEYWQNLLQKISSVLNVSKSVDLLESALVRSPVVVGYLKPLILFPIGAINRLNPEEVEAILAHELAHIKRNDFLINIIVNVIESIFYYHPAMWWLTSQIRREREYCCDDAAIQYTGNPFNYAKSLVSVQEMSMYSPYLAMAFAQSDHKNELMSRVNRLIQKSSTSINMKEKTITGSVILAFLFLLFISFRPAVISTNQPSSQIDPDYIYYNNDGTLDSLKLDYEVTDGDYSYNESNIEVALTVKDKRVVKFLINNLDVKGSDMPKFKNIIDQTLRNNLASDDTEINRSYDLGANLADAIASQLKKDNLLTEEINDIKIKNHQITVNKKPISNKNYIDIFKKNDLNKNEEIELKITSESITLINDIKQGNSNFSYSFSYSDDENRAWKNSPNPPFPQAPPYPPSAGKLPKPPAPPYPPKTYFNEIEDEESDEEDNQDKQMHDEEMKKHEKEMKEHEKQMKAHEREMEAHEKAVKVHEEAFLQYEKARLENEKTLRRMRDDYKASKKIQSDHRKALEKHGEAMEEHNEKMRKHEKEMARLEEYRNKLMSLLKKDGYIKDVDNVQITMTKNSMKVNGTSVKMEDHKKYLDLYKSYGWQIDGDFQYKANYRNQD
jgi:beta-lactamase regulating signal transducer with metallopeptidase domain